MWNCRCTFCGFALHIATLSGSLKFSGMLRRRMLLMYLRYTSLLLSFSINLIFEQQCWWVATQLSISHPVSEISCHLLDCKKWDCFYIQCIHYIYLTVQIYKNFYLNILIVFQVILRLRVVFKLKQKILMVVYMLFFFAYSTSVKTTSSDSQRWVCLLVWKQWITLVVLTCRLS